MQFHIVSFEGPDPYARVGGLATRVEGLARALAAFGFEVHLWFVGDPNAPGLETVEGVALHRWCQWISRTHPGHVYAGEELKWLDLSASLPPRLLEAIAPHLRAGGHAVVLAEEWQTADAVLHLHRLLCQAGLRAGVSLLWNANNVFGFERIDWPALARASTLTTVSRYMRERMRPFGAEPLVIPNGLAPDDFARPERSVVEVMRRRTRGRTVLVKMARFDPSKRWLTTIRIVAEMKRLGWRPLLVARGGHEAHGDEVRRAAAAAGLRVRPRALLRPGASGLLDSLEGLADVDMVELRTHVDPEARRALLRGAAVVLANSGHEPFGLVGLEAMAVHGLACTGCSGEDYAAPGRNALVLETDDPREFLGLYAGLRAAPQAELRLRAAGRATAGDYAWREVLRSVLLPRIDLVREATFLGSGIR